MELAEKFNIEPTKVEELQSGLAIVKSEREVLIDAQISRAKKGIEIAKKILC